MKTRGEPVAEILRFPGNIPLFSQVTETSSRSLAQASTLETLQKGEMLFLQSDPCEAAYVVRTGIVSIVLQRADGREMIINEMRRGYVRRAGDFDQDAHSTSAVARTDCELFVIPEQSFLKIMDAEPGLARPRLKCRAAQISTSTAAA